MVYSGKPSSACEECRVRRTKCDTKKPSCSQCIRANRDCKGYQELGPFIFRDESQTLKSRRKRIKECEDKAKQASILHGKDTISVHDRSILSPSHWVLQKSLEPMLTFTVTIPADEQARCFFFTNYVIRPNTLATSGFEYLIDVYESEEIGSALSDSVAALGMVGLANFWKAPNINFSARSRYRSALKTLSAQLRHVEKAKSDQTLMATMLLGLYETNTGTSQQSMDTWTKHTKGAAALLQLRGKEQVQTSTGYNMFLNLRTQIITNCAQQHYLVPTIVSELNDELHFENPEKSAATKLGQLGIQYCDLRTSMKGFRDYSQSGRIISEACALDAKFDSWAKSCPLEYTYQTVLLKERHEEVFSDNYHTYQNILVATTWNHYRCMRTLLNDLIVDQLLHLLEEAKKSSVFWHNNLIFENMIQSSNAVLLQLCHDICASVPYYLNFQPGSKTGTLPEIPKAVHGNLLLWPLYCAGYTKMVSAVMRTWVSGRLQWISDVMGIQQAGPLALTIARGSDLSCWERDIEFGINFTGNFNQLND